jgi:hypothetical protein
MPHAKPAPVEKKSAPEEKREDQFAQDEQADKGADSGESEEEPAEKPREKIVRVDQMSVSKPPLRVMYFENLHKAQLGQENSKVPLCEDSETEEPKGEVRSICHHCRSPHLGTRGIHGDVCR